MTKIIALCGGPGVGKSTVASGLFSELKQRKISCEYVSEYAKEITWEETQKLLENQLHVFSEQFRRQFRLINKVSYVITDSPLILNSIYFDYYLERLDPKDKIFTLSYEDLCRKFFDSTFSQFQNMTFMLSRTKDYEQIGRNQTLEEAMYIDDRIRWKLAELGLTYTELSGNEKQNIQSILYHMGV